MILYTNQSQIATIAEICTENKERIFLTIFMKFDNMVNTVWNLFFSINSL